MVVVPISQLKAGKLELFSAINVFHPSFIAVMSVSMIISERAFANGPGCFFFFFF